MNIENIRGQRAKLVLKNNYLPRDVSNLIPPKLLVSSLMLEFGKDVLDIALDPELESFIPFGLRFLVWNKINPYF